MQDCQPCSFNVACRAADLFSRTPINSRDAEQSSDSSICISPLSATDRPSHTFLQQGCTTTKLCFSIRHTTEAYLLKHPGRLQIQVAGKQAVLHVRQHVHSTLADHHSFHYKFHQISLKEYSLARSLQQALLCAQPLVHFICEVPHNQQLYVDFSRTTQHAHFIFQ